MLEPKILPRRRVVIVGAGFGGLNAALSLSKHDLDVTLIDRQNHHLFQPLLYQVATAGLSPADIAAPIRSIVKSVSSVRVLMDELTAVDVDARTVALASGAMLPYDELVIATGASHSYFGNDHWSAFAPGIKTIDDAIRVRRDLLLAMERAETMRQEHIASRDKPVTFAVIGGGPTGVEMAGAIAELARHAAEMDFRHITKNCVHVVLIQGGPRLLASFPESLSRLAQKSLEGLGVEVRLDVRVTEIGANGVTIGDEYLPTDATIWAAGVKASPAAQWLGITGDRSGRVAVTGTLTVPDRPEIFVIGDTAAIGHGADFVPGIAAAAKQQGRYVARVIGARAAEKKAPPPFRYRDHGQLATIGRKRAVADFGWSRMSGLPAWILWSTAHIYFLVGFRSRFVVGLNWLWNYVTFERGARLITGRSGTGVM
jgi:NADH dehydrogenase FAD-containing subunit